MDRHHHTWWLRSRFARYLVTRDPRAASSRPVRRADPEVLVWELDEWLRTEPTKLRGMLDELDGAGIHRLDRGRRSDAVPRDPLRERLELAFRSGALVGFELLDLQLPARLHDAPPPEEAPASGPSWFELRVVWDDTGDPVSGLALVIEAPGGGTTMRQTDAQGKLRIDTVYGDACEARSRADGTPLAECASFVRLGDQEVPEEQRGRALHRRAPKAIAVIDRHKVREGETLESIAKNAGLTWQKLAKFNWGTEEPKAVNRHLHNDVGCTRRTKDKKNYLFSAHDDPGIIFVPRPWSLKHLSVAMEHTIRVVYEEYPQVAFLWSA